MRASYFSRDVQDFLRSLIDLINRISGVTFHEAWKRKKAILIEIGGTEVTIHLIGLKDLIKNKEAIGRPKDVEDLKYLRRQREQV